MSNYEEDEEFQKKLNYIREQYFDLFENDPQGYLEEHQDGARRLLERLEPKNLNK